MSATGLLMLCDSAVLEIETHSYHMHYVTYPLSATLLTGTRHNVAPILLIHLGKATAFARVKGTRWENLFTPTLVLTISVS